MLDNTVKIKCTYAYELVSQFDLIQDNNLIGIVFCFAAHESMDEYNINVNWIFFDGYTDEELIYFIQDREQEVIHIVENKIDKEKGIWNYLTRVIANRNVRLLEDLGDMY